MCDILLIFLYFFTTSIFYNIGLSSVLITVIFTFFLKKKLEYDFSFCLHENYIFIAYKKIKYMN